MKDTRVEDTGGYFESSIDAETIRKAFEVLERTRWVPVSERLPKEHIRFQDDPEYVLIFIKNRPGNRVKGFITTGYLSSGIFWGDDNNWKMDEVTHWMPLPEHPIIE